MFDNVTPEKIAKLKAAIAELRQAFKANAAVDTLKSKSCMYCENYDYAACRHYYPNGH